MERCRKVTGRGPRQAPVCTVQVSQLQLRLMSSQEVPQGRHALLFQAHTLFLFSSSGWLAWLPAPPPNPFTFQAQMCLYNYASSGENGTCWKWRGDTGAESSRTPPPVHSPAASSHSLPSIPSSSPYRLLLTMSLTAYTVTFHSLTQRHRPSADPDGTLYSLRPTICSFFKASNKFSVPK